MYFFPNFKFLIKKFRAYSHILSCPKAMNQAGRPVLVCQVRKNIIDAQKGQKSSWNQSARTTFRRQGVSDYFFRKFQLGHRSGTPCPS